MKLALIAAVAKNGAIGKDGQIPWHFPEDMRRFKERTLGRIVIMGRKTYESIGHPLPNRLNIIVTRQRELDLSNQGCAMARSFEEALEFAARALVSLVGPSEEQEVFCVGGAELYHFAMPLADRIYLTLIDKDYRGDAFFPSIDKSVWRCIYEKAAGWQGKKPNRFLGYFLEFDRSKTINPAL